MAEQIRIALADDQHLVRAGFKMVIDSQADLTVVLEAEHGQHLLDQLQAPGAPQVDVVLMDVRMPVLDGISATEQITAQFDSESGPKVIVLTTFDLDEYVLAAIRSGASGFLIKDTPPEQMLNAIRTVHAGEAVIAPTATKRLLNHLTRAELTAQSPSTAEVPPARAQALKLISQLTDREREVLELMAQGLSNTEISQTLFVSQATVKTHVGRVLAKLQARDRVQCVVLAYEAGLVAPSS